MRQIWRELAEIVELELWLREASFEKKMFDLWAQEQEVDVLIDLAERGLAPLFAED